MSFAINISLSECDGKGLVHNGTCYAFNDDALDDTPCMGSCTKKDLRNRSCIRNTCRFECDELASKNGALECLPRNDSQVLRNLITQKTCKFDWECNNDEFCHSGYCNQKYSARDSCPASLQGSFSACKDSNNFLSICDLSKCVQTCKSSEDCYLWEFCAPQGSSKGFCKENISFEIFATIIFMAISIIVLLLILITLCCVKRHQKKHGRKEQNSVKIFPLL